MMRRGAPSSYSGLGRLFADYLDRLTVCKKALSLDGPISPQGGLYSGVLEDPCCAVLLAEVAAFIALAGFTVPDEMRGTAPKVDADPIAAPAAIRGSNRAGAGRRDAQA